MFRFIRGCGVALLVAGILLILINVTLTPLLATDQDDVITRTSGIYLLRLSASLVTAMLLLFGCLGVHLAHGGVHGA